MSRKEIMTQIHLALYMDGAIGGGHLYVRDFSDKKSQRRTYATMLTNAEFALIKAVRVASREINDFKED